MKKLEGMLIDSNELYIGQKLIVALNSTSNLDFSFYKIKAIERKKFSKMLIYLNGNKKNKFFSKQLIFNISFILKDETEKYVFYTNINEYYKELIEKGEKKIKSQAKKLLKNVK
jgi:hypothetical protein